MRDTDLRALRDKYERMLSLRVAHERAKTDASFTEPDPRGAMSDLAREFPGALRELDELPLAFIRDRIASLTTAESDASAIAPWMTASSRFHALARGALLVKRWLSAHPLGDLEGDLATMSESDRADIEPWRDAVSRIAAPPRGRVMLLVYERLAKELSLDVASTRALLTPSRRRS